MSYLTILTLSATLMGTVDANTFLKANPTLSSERISEADVQTSLLAEVEGTLGEGSASSRVKQLEETLRPIYAALPKNEHGYLGHATVRYALHRLFVMRHGWVISGLDDAGGHRNASAGLLKQQVPAYIQDLFEKRLGGRGFGLHELGVLAATIEHLVHSETIKRLGDTMNLYKRLPTSVMSVSEADDLLDTYMMSYILGDAVRSKTLKEALALKSRMPKIYLAWTQTVEFVHKVRRNVTESEASPEQKSSGGLDFSLVARTAERVGEQFGSFQDGDCKEIKASLIKMEDRGTGRVHLSEFYKPALETGNWQFQESEAYLRQLGALDESVPGKPRVIIPNFISSPSNCIASSSFYSVCCMNECEGLLGHLEQELASPEASSTAIARIVSNLPSSSVAAPRKLSPALLDRLGEIALEHSGTVPLHGRLFGQWMHHAFPRECPYPHVAGTTNPQSPDEWIKENGGDSAASKAEMLAIVEKAESEANAADSTETEEHALPWATEEELLVARPSQMQKAERASLFTGLRNFVFFAAIVSAAYGLVQTSMGATKATGYGGTEKFMV